MVYRSGAAVCVAVKFHILHFLEGLYIYVSKDRAERVCVCIIVSLGVMEC